MLRTHPEPENGHLSLGPESAGSPPLSLRTYPSGRPD